MAHKKEKSVEKQEKQWLLFQCCMISASVQTSPSSSSDPSHKEGSQIL